ncbi:MAG: single-stranded-DNA-specific exonuclease RecJ [Phycisphaera sp.]|nr:MAG: single-stranded-DNA-specific exonuclease RecJ [Phycisphaera sp.]
MPPTAPSDAATNLRGLTKRWRLPEPTGPLDASLPPLVARVLAGRPHLDAASLEPKLTGLHDPSGIPDLDKAAEMLLEAGRAGEVIAIYGDYDVDGTTGSAILHHIIRELCPDARLVHFVPHRLRDGYGVHVHAIEKLASDGAGVIVTVDCGITANEPATRARELGVRLIVTDHHNPPATADELPKADAVVHPGRPDSAYPFAGLCGAGVAFKLAWRMATMAGEGGRAAPGPRALLLDLLPLAALGTVADVSPLIDENRIIVTHGLALMRRTRIRGLATLAGRCVRENRPVGVGDLGFRLGPRINALGRVADAGEAIELLTTGDEDRIAAICDTMDELNQQRQAIEKRIVEQACEEVVRLGMDRDEHRAIVLAHEDWHPGVIGIACSRLVERFGRPTILMQRDADVCKGSGRSISGFNLHGAVHACADHVEGFGGHDAAIGLRVSSDRLGAFIEAMVAHANSRLTVEDLTPEVRIDADAGLHELDEKGILTLEKLGPFGRGNPTPRLRLRGIHVSQPPTLMGSSSAHLSMFVRDDAGSTLKLVGWGWGRHAEKIKNGTTLDVVITPRVEEYRGRRSVRGEIADVRTAD